VCVWGGQALNTPPLWMWTQIPDSSCTKWRQGYRWLVLLWSPLARRRFIDSAHTIACCTRILKELWAAGTAEIAVKFWNLRFWRAVPEDLGNLVWRCAVAGRPSQHHLQRSRVLGIMHSSRTFWTANKKATCSFETSETTYPTSRRHIPAGTVFPADKMKALRAIWAAGWHCMCVSSSGMSVTVWKGSGMSVAV